MFDLLSANAKKSKQEVAKFEPKNYMQFIRNIRKMREDNPAPVDTMGCDKCSDDNASDRDKRFQILVSLMLSSQTKDEVTFEACRKLKTIGFNPESLAKQSEEVLQKLLVPVGFYKNKAKYIKKTSQILLDEYDGDIPDTAEGLMKLPGVGPKMAHICMSSAWNKTTGIGVRNIFCLLKYFY
jgi:endonuclease III